MPQAVTIDILDRMRPNLASILQERAKTLAGMRYCDLRISVRDEKGAMAENGNEKASAEDYVFDFGVRAIAGARMSAAGYFGQILGAADADNIESVVWPGLRWCSWVLWVATGGVGNQGGRTPAKGISRTGPCVRPRAGRISSRPEPGNQSRRHCGHPV